MSPLVTAAELDAMIGTVTVLDVRYRMGGPGGRSEYAAGHIPTAAYVDLDTELADQPGPGGRHPLPDPRVFEAAMRRAGVTADRSVVVYDDWEGRAAARCWWLLRHHGHRDVRVLDGGLSAWRRLGGPIEEGTRIQPAGTFEAGPGVLATLSAQSVLAFDRGVMIDARDPQRFRGEVEPVDPVAGHIPGAVNVPTGTNLRADGTFRSGAEIAALYAAAGLEPEVEIGVYCGSGVTAAHDLLALQVAGLDAALYPGSWSEWITDPTRPVQTGG